MTKPKNIVQGGENDGAELCFARPDIKPAFDKDNVAVAFNCDIDFLPYLRVTINSLIKNCPGEKLDLLVFHSEIPELAQLTTRAILPHESRLSIRFVSLKERIATSPFAAVTKTNNVSVSGAYRLAVPEVLVNYNRIVYLDSDIIVVGNIAELFHTDLGGCWLGAVRGMGYPAYVAKNPQRQKWIAENGLTDIDRYFNSGVLLIDCEQYRQHNLLPELFEAKAKGNFFQDQDALNLVYRDHLKLLDDHWNVSVAAVAALSKGDNGVYYRELLEHAKIYHYTTQVKPWSHPYSPYAEIWRKYADQIRESRVVKLNYFNTTSNFGDGLSKSLIEHFTGQLVSHGTVSECDLMAVGSMFGDGARFFAAEGSAQVDQNPNPLVVWGSGFLEPKIPEGKLVIKRRCDIRAVRGKLTREALIKVGILSPDIEVALGDPGLLYPDLVPGLRETPKAYDVAIVPHFIDKPQGETWKHALEKAGLSVVLVDVQAANPLNCLREIASARKVLSSSMHGLIVADALGIPNRRLIADAFFEPGNKRQYDQSHFKFNDYYSAFGLQQPSFVKETDLLNDPAATIAGIGADAHVPTDKVAAVQSALRSSFPESLIRQFQTSIPDSQSSVPSLSVIIPVYNAEQYLHECLASVLTQTAVTDIEVIAVDDGSTDTSPSILAEWSKRDVRLNVISQKNLGPGAARNAALAVARGKYVAFVDSDDALTSGVALKVALEQASNDKLDILFASANKMNAEGKDFGDIGHLRREYIPANKVFAPSELGDNIFLLTVAEPWAKLFSRKFIADHQLVFPELSRSEDFPFVQLAMVQAKRLGVLDLPLCTHRLGLSTSLESTKDKDPLAFQKGEEWFYERLTKVDPDGRFTTAAHIASVIRYANNLRAVSQFRSFTMVVDAAKRFWSSQNGKCLSRQLDSAVTNRQYQRSLMLLNDILARNVSQDDRVDVFADLVATRKLNMQRHTFQQSESILKARIEKSLADRVAEKEAALKRFYEDAKAKSEARIREVLEQKAEKKVAEKEAALKRFYEDAKAKSEARIREVLEQKAEKKVAEKEAALKRFYEDAKVKSEARIREVLEQKAEKKVVEKEAALKRFYEDAKAKSEARMRDAIVRRDELLKKRDGQLAHRETQLASLNELVAELKLQKDRRDGWIRSRDAKIARLTAIVEELKQCTS